MSLLILNYMAQPPILSKRRHHPYGESVSPDWVSEWLPPGIPDSTLRNAGRNRPPLIEGSTYFHCSYLPPVKPLPAVCPEGDPAERGLVDRVG